MNIMLSAKEKHPVTQADVCGSLNLSDKKVLFVFGLANSRGENKVYLHSNGGVSSDFLASHDLEDYSYSENGDRTPELVEPFLASWTRQGFEVAIVGLSKNLRQKDAASYKRLLEEIYAEVLG